MTRHLVDIASLSVAELRHILDLSVAPPKPALSGKGVALIFEKPSNRTRHSMEMAVVQLGGHPVYTRGEEVGLDVRETVEDVTRIMAGYHAVLAARVFRHSFIERMVAVSDVPIINMLSDASHPLQALADIITMEEHVGPIAQSTVAYIGDYNNVARSLAEAVCLLGGTVSLGCPSAYDADDDELERLASLGGSVRQSASPQEAIGGADVVHTDTWISMGQKKSLQYVAKFSRSTALMSLLWPWLHQMQSSCIACRRTVAKKCLQRSLMVQTVLSFSRAITV